MRSSLLEALAKDDPEKLDDNVAELAVGNLHRKLPAFEPLHGWSAFRRPPLTFVRPAVASSLRDSDSAYWVAIQLIRAVVPLFGGKSGETGKGDSELFPGLRAHAGRA